MTSLHIKLWAKIKVLIVIRYIRGIDGINGGIHQNIQVKYYGMINMVVKCKRTHIWQGSYGSWWAGYALPWKSLITVRHALILRGPRSDPRFKTTGTLNKVAAAELNLLRLIWNLESHRIFFYREVKNVWPLNLMLPIFNNLFSPLISNAHKWRSRKNVMDTIPSCSLKRLDSK